VAAGRLSATSTDAVNGSELFATNSAVGTLGTNLTTLGDTTATDLGGGATYTPGGGLSAPAFVIGGVIYNNVGAALVALQNSAPIQYSTAAAPTTPNGYIASQNVTLVGAAAGPVTLDNVAAGALNATSTQAVNGSQLYATNQAVASLTNGTSGLVQQVGGSPGNGAITVGAATGGTTIDVSGTSGTRTITGVSAGAVNATSTDAINGSQLYGTAQSAATALGGGAGVNAAGQITAPTYTIQGTNYNSVGGAFSAVDANLTTLNNDINGGGGIKYFHTNSTLADSTASGANSVAIGPVAVASAANAIAVGNGSVANLVGSVALGAGATTTGASDISGNAAFGIVDNAGAVATGSGNVVSIGAAGAERQLQNVAAGAVTATSTDAVNGSQLYSVAVAGNATGTTLATALGGGAVYTPGLGVSAPAYQVYGSTQNSVGAAIAALQSSSPIQYSNAAGTPTPQTPGDNVALVGTGGPVVLHNVAAGIAGTDAVNVNQLNQATIGANPYSVLYSASTPNTLALASPNNGGIAGSLVTVSNVAPGQLSPTSTQAVNGAQLYATNQAINNLAAFTDGLQNEINTNMRAAYAGTASALAAAGLRYNDTPGKTSTSVSVGYYHNEVGFAAGLGQTSEDGRWRLNAAVTFTPTPVRPDFGAAAGVSYTFD
jgi:autotransporter adhesin